MLIPYGTVNIYFVCNFCIFKILIFKHVLDLETFMGSPNWNSLLRFDVFVILNKYRIQNYYFEISIIKRSEQVESIIRRPEQYPVDIKRRANFYFQNIQIQVFEYIKNLKF